MKKPTFYEEAQADLAEHARREHEKELEKAREIDGQAHRLIRLLTARVRCGVSKGETEFSVNAKHNNVSFSAIGRAVELLLEMGFPHENINCDNQMLTVRVDLPENNAKTNNTATLELPDSWHEGPKNEAIRVINELVKRFQEGNFDANGMTITVEISARLTRLFLFECDRRDWHAFKSALLQRLGSPSVGLSFNKVQNTVMLCP